MRDQINTIKKVNQFDLSCPLVSIVVKTYNSEKFIIDTLESAKAQTYQNIELIVSDDCSIDNTVRLCVDWIKKNKERFINTQCITSPINTGIPANCNRGIKAANGEWIKGIAGDDILDSNCIFSNIEYARKNPTAKIIISNMIVFRDDIQNFSKGYLKTPKHLNILSNNVDSEIQYNALLESYFGNSPTLFIAKVVYNYVTYDENFPFMEDGPFAFNATKMGFAFYYHNAVTAYYRISKNSTCGSKSNKVLFSDYYIKRFQVAKKYRFPFITKNKKWMYLFEYHRKKLIDSCGLNRNNKICRFINSFTIRLNPFIYIGKTTNSPE